MIKWFFLFSLFLITDIDSNSKYPDTNNSIEVCNTTNIAFKSGEKLTYTIYYNWGFIWVAAGEVTFTVQENKNNYLYKAIGKSYPSYNWIYKVDDYFYSYVDKKTLLPIKAKRDINEGGYIIHNNIKFDQQNKKASSSLKINDKEEKIIEKKFNTCMFDILSVIYSLRNTDKSILHKGDRIPFTMMLDDEIYPLSIEYLGNTGKTKVKNLGKFNTIKVSPSVIKGRVFDKNERMNVWISDDKNNLPLIIESPLAIGKIKVILQKHEGLRYPFSPE